MRNIINLIFFTTFLFLASPYFSSLAVDYAARGQWIMSFGYGEHGKFMDSDRVCGFLPGQDNFNSRQKVALQLEAAASENICGQVNFDIGDIIWGQEESGGALGANSAIVKLANAYLSWSPASFPIKVRMGLQSLKTPALASGNSIFNGTVGAVAVNWEFSEWFSTTLAWARPYNNNFSTNMGNQGFLDNVDAFGLLFPLQFEKGRLIPWMVFALTEPNASRLANSAYPFGNFSAMGGDAGNFREGMFPVGGARHRNFSDANGQRAISSRATSFWAGLTGEIDAHPHLNLSFDFAYGQNSWADDSRLNRSGWLATINIESANNWGIPGIYGWYSSGDDANPANGSERLPALDPGNSIKFSPLAYDGASYIERDALIGNNLAGTLGIGVKAANLHILDKVSQTLRANYIRGTNSAEMAKKMSLAGLWANGMELANSTVGAGANLGMPNLYLTQGDYAVELSATSHFRQNDHFSIFFTAGWIGLWLDTQKEAWGARHIHGQSIPSTANAWNLNLTLVNYF